MNKKDFSSLEDQIMSTVSDAFKAIDIANLKRDINYKTEDTINQFKVKFDEYSQRYMGLNKKTKNDISMYINKRPAGSVSGILCMVFGTIGISIYGISVLAFSVVKIFFSSLLIGSNIIFVVLFLFFVASLALLLKGISLRKRALFN